MVFIIAKLGVLLASLHCRLHSLPKNTVLDFEIINDPICVMKVVENKAKFVSESRDVRKVYLC